MKVLIIYGYGKLRLMLKPIRWKTFLRDFLVAQFGFIIYGLSIALIIQADLGTGPWAVLAVALADLFGTTPGLMLMATGVLVLIGAILLKEQIGWGTISNILFIGPWVDLFLLYIPPFTGNLWIQVPALLISILLTGIATAIYIGVNAGAGPRDSLMLAISRVTGRTVLVSRAIIELLVVVIGWILGGPVGIGTLAFALLIGPAVQTFFKIFKVRPHQSGQEIV